MPISPEAYHLNTFMQRIVDTAVEIFTEYGVDLPSKRYWTAGTAVIDCEQLVVSLVQLYLGAPGDQADAPQRLMVPRTAVCTLTIARWEAGQFGVGVIATVDIAEPEGGLQAVNMQLTMAVP